MKLRRSDALLAAILAVGGISGACLGYFVWGMVYMQDLWDVSLYAAYLVGGLVAAIAAAVAAETLRRSHKEAAASALGGLLITLAWTLLAIQVLAFLYCNAGPVRTISTNVVRRLVTYGMARDLPIPPAAP